MPNIDRLLSPKQLKLIRTFAKDPAEFYDQKAEKAASYNPASATIMGILKDMYDTFSMNLEKATEVEAVAQKNYESLIGVKENEMATLVAARTKKEGEKADAEKELADTSQDLDDSNEVDTENLGVQTRVEVTRWSVFAITIEISHRSINKGSTVRANALAAVSPEPVAVAITLGGFTTGTMPSTVVWASSTCETENREERENLHVESCVCVCTEK